MPPPTRRAATFVWAAMFVVPLAFMAIVFEAKSPWMPELRGVLFWLSIGVSFLDVTLSRALPPRLGANSSDPAAVGFMRLLVGWALCEAAALAPLVAYTLTRDPRLLGILALDLFALVLLFPTDARWQAVTVERAPGAEPTRMVR